MKFRWKFFKIGLSAIICTQAFLVNAIADSFDLPEDVDSAEVIRFVPITTNTVSDIIDTVNRKCLPDSSQNYQAKIEQNDLANLPQTNAKNFSQKNLDEVSLKIPDELNRPIRVGLFVGVKELFVKYDGEVVRITPAQNSIKITAGKNVAVVDSKEISSENCLAVAESEKLLSKSCYPGDILFKSEKGKLTAINSLDVEDYLRGVVPYEIGKLDSSRIEALKAQAVAARTYAYKHFNSREALGFDVYADTKDQVYKGLESATALTNAAVKATAGVVMTYNGEFIIAYYHSTCGGVTETLATWNRPDLPYLQSVKDKNGEKNWCEESSYTHWERRFSENEIAKLFKSNFVEAKAKGSNDFKKVKNITVAKKLKSGRILTLNVTTDKGVFEVQTDRTRWLFKKNGTILPSSFFDIKKVKSEYVLTGTGFGHGVGMCQMGVRGMAKAGINYQKILKHYYSGILLEKFER